MRSPLVVCICANSCWCSLHKIRNESILSVRECESVIHFGVMRKSFSIQCSVKRKRSVLDDVWPLISVAICVRVARPSSINGWYMRRLIPPGHVRSNKSNEKHTFLHNRRNASKRIARWGNGITPREKRNENKKWKLFGDTVLRSKMWKFCGRHLSAALFACDSPD